jgi:hypothetical protein
LYFIVMNELKLKMTKMSQFRFQLDFLFK